MSKENDPRSSTMRRGKQQSLYKYLPESWIDFRTGDGKARRQYIAKVVRWRGSQVLTDSEINTGRLLRAVENAVNSFRTQAPEPERKETLLGFGDELAPDTPVRLSPEEWEVLTPLVPKGDEDDAAIQVEISPLTFYCGNCHKVYQFKTQDAYLRHMSCTEPGCQGRDLFQLRQIYYCACGFASPWHPVWCKEHGDQAIYWDGTGRDRYRFTCRAPREDGSGICGRRIEMKTLCDNEACGSNRLRGPKPALDSAQFFAHSLSLIDLIDGKTERFLAEEGGGKYLVIAHWLDERRFTAQQLRDAIDSSLEEVERAQRERLREIQRARGLLFGGGPDEDEALRELLEETEDLSPSAEQETLEQTLEQTLKETSKAVWNNQASSALAEMLLEYERIRQAGETFTLERAMEIAGALNRVDPAEYRRAAEDLRFQDVRACDGVPFVFCSYGYTRVRSEYQKGAHVRLRALKKERRGSGKAGNVYATRMETEGVLFTLDRRAVVRWLLKNKFTKPESAPELMELIWKPDLDEEEERTLEQALKLWFINHIHPEVITPFGEISKDGYRETRYVYRLIHSISHILIRAAANTGGLGKESLSEYIFPGIPAVLVYVQNAQGFNLGSLRSTFEMSFPWWLAEAQELARTCVFDPICLEEHKACTGCMFLGEVSCQHFNKDLDRSLLIGHTDRKTGTRTYGFWEPWGEEESDSGSDAPGGLS